MDYSILGKSAIPGSAPTGSDVRSSDEFIDLQAELQKQSDPSAGSGPDWQRMLDLSASVLTSKSKDLAVMSYFVCAQIKINGISGLLCGLENLSDLVLTYWNDLFPDLNHLRGRRKSLSWVNDQVLEYLRQETIAPVEPDVIQQVIDVISDLDKTLSELDPEAPSFFNLIPYIKALPVMEAATDEPETTPPLPSADSAPSENQTSNDKRPANAPTVTSSAGAAALATVLSSTPIADTDSANKALTEASQRIAEIAGVLLADNLRNPLPYRLSRFAAWCALTELPPVTNGHSMVPPPQGRAKTIRDTLVASNNLKDLVAFAESQVCIDTFWLDLNRISYQALESLGSEYVESKQEIATQVSLLLQHFPQIATYQFSDGTPFADNATQQWLKTLSESTASSTGTSGTHVDSGRVSEGMNKTIQEAYALSAQGKVSEALQMLQTAIESATNAPDRLRSRVHICKIASAARKECTPFADILLATVTEHDLTTWDPQGASEALEAAYIAYKDKPDFAEKSSRTLVLLATIDPAKAFLLQN